ncbi:hypothetical protein BN381_220009 [Candidatus Microthrix parvicella RN1]|uniref:Uncharacterized protein n=1 Tax=Candidatus Neomicrothrix parvicella RN1 TaxID=1229780 RepID=R4YYM1_9ACTN|nr:hypothetical protein BN381_220009 [Candidatus Microthrix parvicella RN1]
MQGDWPNIPSRLLDDSVDADSRREVGLGSPDLGDFDFAEPASLVGRAGHDKNRVLPERQDVVRRDDDGWPDETRLSSSGGPEVTAEDVTCSHRPRRSQKH